MPISRDRRRLRLSGWMTHLTSAVSSAAPFARFSFRQKLEALLDRQDEIEAASYDSRIGRQAVWAARQALSEGLAGVARKDQKAAAVAILEELKQRQDRVQGDYSTGGSTVGSILRQVRAL